jgi:hypothetical protein
MLLSFNLYQFNLGKYVNDMFANQLIDIASKLEECNFFHGSLKLSNFEYLSEE